jgi:DNA-binding protein H-NS
MDLEQMDMDELRRLIKAATAEIERRRKADKKKTIQEIKRLIQGRGYNLEELLGAPTSRKNGGAKEKNVRYRHPEDPDKTWTGMGRKPVWLKEWIESGRSLDELRLQ